MNPKTKRIVTIIAIGIPSLLIVVSALFKFSDQNAIVDQYNKIGIAPYLKYLGLSELVFTGLFIYNKTFKLGLLLLTGYLGGAFATQLSHGGQFGIIILLLALLWIAAFIRDRSAFLLSENTVKSSTI